MKIPNFENIQFTQKSGYLTEQWQLILQELITQLQQNIGQNGFFVTSISSASSSVTPPTAGGQLAQVQALFGSQNPVPPILIFDPAESNGGAPGAPNGQLKILLGDGTFHKITNS